MNQSEKFLKEYKALDLAKIFRNEFILRGYGFKIYSLKDIEKTKWWKYFVDVIDAYSEREEWDAYLFIKTMFDKYGKVYPHVISRKNAWDIYLEYLPTYKEDSSLKEEVGKIVSDYKKVHRLMEEKNINGYKDFFVNPYACELIRRGAFSGNLFIFMKSFYENYSSIYNIEESVPEVQDRFKVKRIKFMSNYKVKSFLQKVLKEEMLGV
jgi:hypothetical protein